MPTFLYTAKSANGETKTGSLEANNASEIARLLRNEGLVLTSIKEERQKTKKHWRWADFFYNFFGIPLEEKMMFASHLGVMIGAGLSLSRSLEALSQQTSNERFVKVINQINEDVKKGNPLANSLAAYPRIFSDLFVNMTRVGETSGNLEEVLRVLAEQMKKDYELKSRVKSAMIYPIVIITAMFGIGAVMMIVVVPKLTQVFKELHAELPFTTKIIIFISDYLNKIWPALLIALFFLIIIGRYLWRLKTIQNYFDALLLRLPIFGNISKKINSARFARTLGVLIKSGVPIVQALNIVAGTLTNVQFRKSLVQSSQEVQKGQMLSLSLKKYHQFYPAMVSQMIEVGEETGTLDQILLKLAEFYEEEVNNITKSLASIIEPVLMIIIGAAVGFFAISMLMPMYSMMQNI